MQWPILANLHRAAACAAVLAVAGCASVEEPPPALPASADVVHAAAFSRMPPQAGLPAEWLPYIILPSKPKTAYRLARTENGVVLESDAQRSASGLYRVLRVDPSRHRWLEWAWKIERLIPGADNRIASREDSPVRLIVAFGGDPAKIDFFERGRMRLARALSGQELPYATLMYVWSGVHPEGTVIHNPHTSRIRMIVAESGAQRAGTWVRYRRDLAADYRKAFEEDPAEVHAIGVMTDTDNTRESARAWYGDITLRTPSATAR